ncbi:MAG TPA: DUF3592 domain-containing protein [Bryobacteraceae bacterium]|jgi:hypothetical protein|nr:DUF3592 domain-containing protein [Bryobacteraceae bacterium]
MDRLEQALIWNVEAIVAVIVFKILLPAVGRKRGPIPGNWRVERRPGEIIVTERGTWAMGLMCLLLTTLAVLGILELARIPHNAATLWFAFLGLFVAIFWYATLAGFVNRTVFAITPEGIRMRSGPLPEPGSNEWFPADEIVNLHCHSGYIRGGRVYTLSFRTQHGKVRAIGPGYDLPNAPIALGRLIQEMIPGLDASLEMPGKRRWGIAGKWRFVAPFAKAMAVLAAAIGLFALGLAVHKTIHIRSLASTTGTVTAVQECTHCLAPYSFYVTFQANGHPVHQYVPTDVLSARAEGDTVTVLYDARNPEKAEINAIDDEWIVIAMIFAAALILPSIFLAIIWFGSR